MRFKQTEIPENIRYAKEWKLLSVFFFGETEIAIYKVEDSEQDTFIVIKYNNYKPVCETERVMYEVVDLNPYDY
tara:strand:- start:1056 stop:1277 length:222 start_codon:yes stop_codon:yes gene_type:complete